MSRFGGGELGFTFTGEDRDFQQAAGRAEKTMAQVAAEFKRQAVEIDLAIAKARHSTEGLSDSVETSMRKASAAFRRDAKAITDAAKESGDGVSGFITNVRQFTLLHLFASGVGAMGKALEEMSAKVREGKASTGDLIEKVAEGIPVIGKFIEAGRGIREAITGEKSYTEVLKEQTAQQEKRIALTKEYSEALKKLSRDQEDFQTRLNRRPGDSSFAAAFGLDVTTATRAADDVQKKVGGALDDVIKKIGEEKTRLGQELQDLISTRGGNNAFAGFVPGEASARAGRDLTQDVEGQRLIEIKRKQIDDLGKEEERLRGEIAKTEDLTRATIGRGLLTRVGQLVGSEFVKGFDAAAAAVERFIGKIRPLNSETQKALSALSPALTPAQTLNGSLISFTGDLNRGNISAGQFDQLKQKATLDALAESVKRFGVGFKAKFDTLLPLIDSYLGAPIAQSVQLVKKVAAEFPFPSSIAIPKVPAAQFLSADALSNRIQESAASDPVEIAKQQLEEQRGGRKVLDQIQVNTKRGGRAVVS